MAELMNAAVIDRYGGPERLHLGRVPIPEISPDEVLVKVLAAAVNPADWHIRKGELVFLKGWRFPRVLGMDLAGEVVRVGANVTSFKPGDAVCCYKSVRDPVGTYAEYTTAPAALLAPKPSNLDFVQAAGVPLAGTTALQGLRDKGQVKPGMQVLVIGASGGVGTLAVQIARAMGARVTGVCSGRNAELVRGLGAEEVIDYTREDFAKRPERYDVIFDAANASYRASKPALKPGGCFVSVAPSKGTFLSMLIPGSQRPRILMAHPDGGDLRQLTRWIEEGKLKPVIDRVLPLSQAAEAHKLSESGRARGKLVLVPDGA